MEFEATQSDFTHIFLPLCLIWTFAKWNNQLPYLHYGEWKKELIRTKKEQNIMKIRNFMNITKLIHNMACFAPRSLLCFWNSRCFRTLAMIIFMGNFPKFDLDVPSPSPFLPSPSYPYMWPTFKIDRKTSNPLSNFLACIFL